MLENIAHDSEIDDVIAVNQNVAKTRHLLKVRGQVGIDPPARFQRGEELAIGPRLPEALVRHDVGRHVEGGLNGELLGVLSETPLANVGLERTATIGELERSIVPPMRSPDRK